jgi:hypothetical protein
MNNQHLLSEAILACRYAEQYDQAIRVCANDGRKMASFCTAKGESLDLLYMRWQQQSQKVLEMVERQQ